MLFRITTCIILATLVGCGGSSDSGSTDTTGGDTTGGDTTGGDTTGGDTTGGDTTGGDTTGGDTTGSDTTGGDTTGGDTTGGLTGSFNFFGYLDLIDDTVEDRINYDANFLQMTQEQDASVFVNSVPPAIDSCNLRITDTIPTDVGVIGFPDAPFTLVSAGENFTLTSAAGTYATVNYADGRFDVAPYPAPENLVLDIPGAVFPAFSDVAVPDVIRVNNFSIGRNDLIQADTTITWEPSGVAGNIVYLSVFDIFTSNQVVNLYCSMADDGEFNLPASVQTTLNASLGAGAGLAGGEQDLRSITTVVQGDAFLVVSKIIQNQ